MSEDTELAPEPVNLAEALKQMDDDGNPPVGFHMMFFSSEFKNAENCPTLQLLKMLGAEYNFGDTIKRQVFQMPKDLVIMSYEFAWLGGFEGLQEAMEGINKSLKTNSAEWLKTNPSMRYHKTEFHSWQNNPITSMTVVPKMIANTGEAKKNECRV